MFSIRNCEFLLQRKLVAVSAAAPNKQCLNYLNISLWASIVVLFSFFLTKKKKKKTWFKTHLALKIYHHFLFGSIRKAIRDLPHAPMPVRRSSDRPDSHSAHPHDDIQRASSHGTPPGDDNAAKVTRRALPSLPAKQSRAQQLAQDALADKTQFDFDNIERSLPRLLTAFESGHRAFLKVFLQTQQFHFCKIFFHW